MKTRKVLQVLLVALIVPGLQCNGMTLPEHPQEHNEQAQHCVTSYLTALLSQEKTPLFDYKGNRIGTRRMLLVPKEEDRTVLLRFGYQGNVHIHLDSTGGYVLLDLYDDCFDSDAIDLLVSSYRELGLLGKL